jgi:hypothetical protein
MTYHDAQGNEIEDLESDKMKVEFCWLCGSTDIWESGLCQRHYAWAEDIEDAQNPDGPPWSEDEFKMLYEAEFRALGSDPAGVEAK